MALFKVDMSEMRLESLAWRKSSAGFKLKITTTDKTAMIAITIKSSMRVKPLRSFVFIFIYFLGINEAVNDLSYKIIIASGKKARKNGVWITIRPESHAGGQHQILSASRPRG